MRSRPASTPARRVSRAEEKLRAFHEEGAIGKAYDARLIARLWPYVKPHGRYVIASLVTLALITLTAGTYPARRARELTPMECLRSD